MSKTLYVDSELLEEKILKSGLKKQFLCEKLGISRQGFYKKLNGTVAFKIPEVFVLCNLLSIDDNDSAKIFYPKEQPKG